MILRGLLLFLLVAALLFGAGCDGYFGRSRRVRPEQLELENPEYRYLHGAGYDRE